MHHHLITAILTHENGRVWCFPPGFAVSHFWSGLFLPFLACCSHFWASLVCSQLPFLDGPLLPPITNHLSHDSHLAWRLQLSAKKHHEIMPAMVLFRLRCLITFFLRDINQKIFPILTVTDMSANQWSQFVKKDSGFAFLAYWNDMLV